MSLEDLQKVTVKDAEEESQRRLIIWDLLSIVEKEVGVESSVLSLKPAERNICRS